MYTLRRHVRLFAFSAGARIPSQNLFGILRNRHFCTIRQFNFFFQPIFHALQMHSLQIFPTLKCDRL